LSVRLLEEMSTPALDALDRARAVEYEPPGDGVEIHTPIPAG